jgi:hypothetical protein
MPIAVFRTVSSNVMYSPPGFIPQGQARLSSRKSADFPLRSRKTGAVTPERPAASEVDSIQSEPRAGKIVGSANLLRS